MRRHTRTVDAERDVYQARENLLQNGAVAALHEIWGERAVSHVTKVEKKAQAASDMNVQAPDKWCINPTWLIMSSTQLSSEANASSSCKKHLGSLARAAADAAAAENPA